MGRAVAAGEARGACGSMECRETAAQVAARAEAERAAASAAVEAAAAARLAAPAAAQQLASGHARAWCVYHQPTSSLGSWQCTVVHHSKAVSWYFSSRLDACCAADLARLALYGPLASYLNLPAATYTPQQLAAWQQLLRVWRVGVPAGDDPAAASGHAVELAADTAVAAAADKAVVAAPAEAAMFSGQQRRPHGS